ncbi:MAG: ATP-binding cassette domain-containing protein [Clostridia bacterium]|nr:ATP-binding cassette domain-containing protein [Clostridia bacterium]
MLEVRNLSKIYKSTVKNGVDTKALDDISLTFPEKGMVFLLGKSGSGKSTLLNVCGGLDAPTSGEIIVKGKSSKNFSQSDFDSYRNTFIGFIFQEYNILNEFSVEDNIALALELQGKPKNKKAIAALLEQVELSGFAKRKPNTLSGGQKQRIAIARALVKSPEIIMADEPTGALDSATGKQVFDTLKKLSADKLVIVVSHDRDFAELYGDRIIELKDGQILSDISKTEQKQTALTDSISALDGVLCIKQGASLSNNDFEQIKSFLASSNGDVIIAKNEKDISKFKKAAHINDDGSKEYFTETDESKLDIKQYGPKDSKFIRSKLPLRHASKIGVSSLKTKPFRLVLTILLCTVAFVLFGLLSTLTFYDSELMFKQTLSDSQRDYVTLEKSYLCTMQLYENGELLHESDVSNSTNFSEEDIEKLREIFGNDVFGAFNLEWQNMNFTVRSGSSAYWNTSASAIAYVPEGNSFRNKITLGNYPEKDGEIAISSYTAESLINSSVTTPTGEVINASSPDDLLNKTVVFGADKYKIVGIFDAGTLDPKYEVLKDGTTDNYSLESSFNNELTDGLYRLVLLSKDNFDTITKNMGRNDFAINYETRSFSKIIIPSLQSENGSYGNQEEYPSAYYYDASSLNSSNVYYFDSSKEAVSDSEALISEREWTNLLYNIVNQKYQRLIDEVEIPEIDWEDKNSETDYAEAIAKQNALREKLDKYTEKINLLSMGEKQELGEDGNVISTIPLTSDERDEIIRELIAEFGDELMTVELSPVDSSDVRIGDTTTYTVVGIVSGDGYSSAVFVSTNEFNRLWEAQRKTLDYYSTTITNYVATNPTTYSTIYAPFSNTANEKDLLWDLYQNEEFDENASRISISGRYISELQMIDALVKSLSQVFFYVGLVLALFAILLFSNFISTSISQKRREIGILRAVGARGADVFKIFFSESFVIAFICSLLATTGTTIICSIVNEIMAAELGASIFVFGPFSILIIIGTALLTAILATFIPVWLAARKKPVESIKSL